MATQNSTAEIQVRAGKSVFVLFTTVFIIFDIPGDLLFSLEDKVCSAYEKFPQRTEI